MYEDPFANENISELFADRMVEWQEIYRRLREILPEAARGTRDSKSGISRIED